MYNRDRYDRLTRSLNKLIEIEADICDVEWSLSHEYPTWESVLSDVRKRIDKLSCEIDEEIERFTVSYIEFGDGNKTDRQEFVDIINKKKEKTRNA